MPSERERAAESEQALRVMSINVRNMNAPDGDNQWALRRELLFGLIRKNSPDILATQEAFFPQVEELKQALPDYASVGVGRDDGATQGEYCALFFRQDRFRMTAQGTFWFSPTPDVPGSRHPLCYHARICTWSHLTWLSGQGVTIYNVHLDHESQTAREQSVRLLRDRIRRQEPFTPVLVMGDFNMLEDNPAMKALTTGEPALRDTFRLLHPDATDCGTFHGFTGRSDGERIDFILAPSEFQAEAASILREHEGERYPSDHFPVTAQLRLVQRIAPAP